MKKVFFKGKYIRIASLFEAKDSRSQYYVHVITKAQKQMLNRD